MFSNAFNRVGTIEYEGLRIDNIFRNVYPIFDIVVQAYQKERYTIEGTPTAPELAEILYDDVELYWVFYLLNNRIDPFDDWILSDAAVYQKAVEIWGVDSINDTHHYVSLDGEIFYDVVENNNVWYDIGDTGFTKPFYTGTLSPVTNYEFLLAENEKNREIEIIPPEQIQSFVDDLRRELSRNVRA